MIHTHKHVLYGSPTILCLSTGCDVAIGNYKSWVYVTHDICTYHTCMGSWVLVNLILDTPEVHQDGPWQQAQSASCACLKEVILVDYPSHWYSKGYTSTMGNIVWDLMGLM